MGCVLIYESLVPIILCILSLSFFFGESLRIDELRIEEVDAQMRIDENTTRQMTDALGRRQFGMSQERQPSVAELEDLRQSALDLRRIESRFDSAVKEIEQLASQKAAVGAELRMITDKFESMSTEVDRLSFKGDEVRVAKLTPELFSLAEKKKQLGRKVYDIDQELKQLTFAKTSAESLKGVRTKFGLLSEAFPAEAAAVSKDPYAFDAKLGKFSSHHETSSATVAGDRNAPTKKTYLQISGKYAVTSGSIIITHTDIVTAAECMKTCDRAEECNSFFFGMVEGSPICAPTRYSYKDHEQHDLIEIEKVKSYYVIPDQYWKSLKARHESSSTDPETDTQAERPYTKPKKKWDLCAFGSVSWLSVVEHTTLEDCQRACDAHEKCASILFPKVLNTEGKGLCITTTGRENDYSDVESQTSKCAIMELWDGDKAKEKHGEMGVYFVPETYLQLVSSMRSRGDSALDRKDERVGLYKKLVHQDKVNGCPNFAWWETKIGVTSEHKLKHCEEACDVTPTCKSFLWIKTTCIMLTNLFGGSEKFYDFGQRSGDNPCENVQVYYASNHASSLRILDSVHAKREVTHGQTRSLVRGISRQRHPFSTFTTCAESTKGHEISQQEDITYQDCAKRCNVGDCKDFLRFSDGYCVAYSKKLTSEETRCIFGKSMLSGTGLWNERPYHKLQGCWREAVMLGGRSWWDFKLDAIQESDVELCKQVCSNTYPCMAVMHYGAEETCILLHIPWDQFDPQKLSSEQVDLCADTETHYVITGTFDNPQNGQCCNYVWKQTCKGKTYKSGAVRQVCPIHTTVWWEYPAIINNKRGGMLDGNSIFKGDYGFECPLVAGFYTVEILTAADPSACSPQQVNPDDPVETCKFVDGETDCNSADMKSHKRKCEDYKEKFKLTAGRDKNTGICLYDSGR